jgi:hypothetical protein
MVAGSASRADGSLAHYDAIRPELGERFANAVVETAEAIATMPLRFAVVDTGRRRAGVRWFPYGLFFLVEETPRRRDRLLSWQAQPEALATARVVKRFRASREAFFA